MKIGKDFNLPSPITGKHLIINLSSAKTTLRQGISFPPHKKEMYAHLIRHYP